MGKYVNIEDVKRIISQYHHSPFMDMEIYNLESQEREREKCGRWIRTEDGDWQCSHCGCEIVICDCGKDRTYRKAFCPECGARTKTLVDNSILDKTATEKVVELWNKRLTLIVFCKDCKFRHNCIHHTGETGIFGDYDFCSMGEMEE